MGAAEPWLVGAAPAASFSNTVDAGGTSAQVAVSLASGLMDTAGSAAISILEGNHRNMAWFQASRIAAVVALWARSGLTVRWPLEWSNAQGRVERWQSPVDRARLEIV